jgi:hypothetical protein
MLNQHGKGIGHDLVINIQENDQCSIGNKLDVLGFGDEPNNSFVYANPQLLFPNNFFTNLQ